MLLTTVWQPSAVVSLPKRDVNAAQTAANAPVVRTIPLSFQEILNRANKCGGVEANYWSVDMC